MQRLYPHAMNDFCNWIDQYKKQNDWDKIFNTGSPHYIKMGWHNIKFHDLPLAMQMGIWSEYLDSYSINNCKDGIEMFLSGTEEGIQEKLNN